jgi:hypothetical protein
MAVTEPIATKIRRGQASDRLREGGSSPGTVLLQLDWRKVEAANR